MRRAFNSCVAHHRNLAAGGPVSTGASAAGSGRRPVQPAYLVRLCRCGDLGDRQLGNDSTPVKSSAPIDGHEPSREPSTQCPLFPAARHDRGNKTPASTPRWKHRPAFIPWYDNCPRGWPRFFGRKGEKPMRDAQLRNEVQDELEWEPSVNASEIGVTAHDGVVTLTGLVPSYAEKLAAARRPAGAGGQGGRQRCRAPAAGQLPPMLRSPGGL